MKNHSKVLILTIVFSFTLAVGIANAADAKGEDWVSPDKSLTLHLVATDLTPHNPPQISLVAEVSGRVSPIPEFAMIKSPIRREYAGTSWLWNTTPRWSGNRFAIFEAIAIASPLWKAASSQNRVIVGIWNWSNKEAEAISFDALTLKLRGSEKMNLVVPDKIAYSPWIDEDFEAKVTQALGHSDL